MFSDKQLELLAKKLAEQRQRFVLAESCTGGLVSSSLTQLPGISQWYCGSMVTYRGESKIQWLGVPQSIVAQDDAVNSTAAEQMAVKVLEKTPEAQWSASVTGHFGPDAPGDLDGIIFVAVAHRVNAAVALESVHEKRLESTARVDRQREATAIVLQTLAGAICEAQGRSLSEP